MWKTKGSSSHLGSFTSPSGVPGFERTMRIWNERLQRCCRRWNIWNTFWDQNAFVWTKTPAHTHTANSKLITAQSKHSYSILQYPNNSERKKKHGSPLAKEIPFHLQPVSFHLDHSQTTEQIYLKLQGRKFQVGLWLPIFDETFFFNMLKSKCQQICWKTFFFYIFAAISSPDLELCFKVVGRRGDFVRRAELPKPLLMSSRVYIRGTYHVTVWTLVFKDLVKHRRWVCPANMFPPLILLFLKHTRLPARLGQLCFLHRRAHTLSHTPRANALDLRANSRPASRHLSFFCRGG